RALRPALSPDGAGRAHRLDPRPMANVLITGCSSGFGLLTALHFARRGDRVFATMRNPAKGEKLRAAATAEKLPLSVHRLDVVEPASIRTAVDEVLAAGP